MMTTALQGNDVGEARELFDRFHALVTGSAVDAAAARQARGVRGVAEFPMRVKCATLAWHAMKEAALELRRCD